MQASIATVTRCSASGGHYHFTGTIGGQERTITFLRDELTSAPADVREAFLQRVRSHLLENGISTFPAAKTELEGISFHL